MKKIFTLLALLCALLVNAQTYQFYYNGKTPTFDPEGFFTKSDKFNSNAKFYGTIVLADGTSVECTQGLKMEGATDLSFATDRLSTVKVVQSTAYGADKTIKFDGAELENGVTNPEGYANSIVYTVENVAAGEHHVTRGSGEAGVLYVGVTLAELTGEQLEAPEVTFEATTGLVTIAPVVNATKVTYTTDGSVPSAESTEYTEPFTVADGTTVKAMAIGNGSTYENSPVTTVEVYLSGLTCAAPAFAQFNGTFALATETPFGKIEYSLDGENWVEYTIPVTLFNSQVVKARTTRENWTTSEVAEAEIEALPAVENTKTVILGGGGLELSADKNSLVGKPGTELEGYSIAITSDPTKTWSILKDKVTIDAAIDLTRTIYHGSNGAENTLYLPEGVKAYRVILYSIMPTLGKASGWKINGENNQMGTLTPLCSQNLATPDVRAFNLDGVEGSFTFANYGERPDFLVALEVTDETVGIENVAVDNNNAPVEYYNLQGVRVQNPENGLYIRRQGNDVKKVIL